MLDKDNNFFLKRLSILATFLLDSVQNDIIGKSDVLITSKSVQGYL